MTTSKEIYEELDMAKMQYDMLENTNITLEPEERMRREVAYKKAQDRYYAALCAKEDFISEQSKK